MATHPGCSTNHVADRIRKHGDDARLAAITRKLARSGTRRDRLDLVDLHGVEGHPVHDRRRINQTQHTSFFLTPTSQGDHGWLLPSAPRPARVRHGTAT